MDIIDLLANDNYIIVNKKVEDMNKTVVIPLTKYLCEDIQKGMK